jgi:hypothetical protein
LAKSVALRADGESSTDSMYAPAVIESTAR